MGPGDEGERTTRCLTYEGDTTVNIIEQRKQARGQAGFTLIELLVVIAILAVLAGAAIVGIGAMRSNAQETACKSDRDTLQTAAEAYKVDTESNPADVAALLSSGYAKKVDNADWQAITTDSDGNFVVLAGSDAGDKYEDVAADCNA